MSPRVAPWLAWSLAALSAVLFVASFPLLFLARSVRVPESWDANLSIGNQLSSVLMLVFSVVGALIASRHPRNPIGWIFLVDGLLWNFLGFTDYYGIYGVASPGSLPFPVLVAGFSNFLWVPAVGLLGTYAIMLFPDGKLPSRRWRPLAWLTGVTLVSVSLLVALSPAPLQSLGGTQNPFALDLPSWVEGATYVILPLLPLCMLASAASLLARYRRAVGEQRQQIKWIAFAAVIVVLMYLAAMVSSFVFPSWGWFSAGSPWWMDLLAYAALSSLVAIPVAVGFAVLKYRLYDIDILINRTLVYGVLTVSVVGLYVLIVAALGLLFRARGGLAVSLVAAGVVAVAFAPLRERLQRGVNRLMYGERDDPYAVLSRMGRRLEATIAPKAALTTIVETIAQALKVPYVAIAVGQGIEGFETVAEHGTAKEEPLVLPLVYQRATIGRLVVAPRAPGEAFSPADMRLLEDLARQVEVAVHAVRLTADLQRSRERLVTAREEERRRLRRDLHDGLGPTLGALTLGLDTTRLALAQEEPKAVEALLLELKSQTQEAVSDVRRLVYGLRPPALDDLGLVPAIRQQASSHGLLAENLPNGRASGLAHSKNELVFQVEASDDLPSLPAAVEVACYRIAQEAIANAARHSGASSCRLNLSLDEADGMLQLEVADNGTGIPEDRSAGVGMSSMRERAEELGGTLTVGVLPEGGTRVLARLPIPATEEEE